MRQVIRKTIIGFGALIAVLAIGLIVLWIILAPHIREQREVRAMPIGQVDFSRVSNGRYTGDFTYLKAIERALEKGISDFLILRGTG